MPFRVTFRQFFLGGGLKLALCFSKLRISGNFFLFLFFFFLLFFFSGNQWEWWGLVKLNQISNIKLRITDYQWEWWVLIFWCCTQHLAPFSSKFNLHPWILNWKLQNRFVKLLKYHTILFYGRGFLRPVISVGSFLFAANLFCVWQTMPVRKLYPSPISITGESNNDKLRNSTMQEFVSSYWQKWRLDFLSYPLCSPFPPIQYHHELFQPNYVRWLEMVFFWRKSMLGIIISTILQFCQKKQTQYIRRMHLSTTPEWRCRSWNVKVGNCAKDRWSSPYHHP